MGTAGGDTDLCIATFMSNVTIVPVSTWNTYNILDGYNTSYRCKNHTQVDNA